MMRSLYSGVSGLKNHQTRMDVIGNNISNVNTTGFKSSRVNFVDTLQQTLVGASAPSGNLGGTNPKQIGLGSGVGSIDMLMNDGSIQSTGKNTDLCLSGSGFFVVKNGSDVYYTRDGAFEFDADGNYVLPGSGLYVQGVMATDGVLPESIPGDPKSLQNIVIKAGKSMAATATTQADFVNNLDASVATITALSATKTDGTAADPADTYTIGKDDIASVTVTMSDGNIYTMTEKGSSYTKDQSLPISTIITVCDTLGNTHDVPIYFTKTKTDSSAGNQWTVSVAKDGSGKTTLDDGTVVEMADVTLQFDTSGKWKSGAGLTKMTLTNGAAAKQDVAVTLSELTQYAGSSTISASADGNQAGTLSSITIDSSGIITGSYTNGINQAEAQIAIAQFNNPSGLTKQGTSLYKNSNNSGTANIKDAASLGVTITPSALEMSNVDIANEFSDMIITQRGFQSNSKIITVSDEMLETLVNMKR